MESHVRQVLKELRSALLGLYGPRLRRMVVFGSQARGEGTVDSDVDVMVVLAGHVDSGREVTRASSVLSDLSLRHDVVLSCVFVSSARFARERSPLFLNVRREGSAV